MSSLNCHLRLSIFVRETLEFEWQCSQYLELNLTCVLEATNTMFSFNNLHTLFRGHGDTRIGLKEISGGHNNPASVRFIDGSTVDYTAPMSLNDASSCVRFNNGGLGDESCNKLYNFLCMSDPILQGRLG